MIKNILWDFDGVILDSMEIRDSGFEIIFNNFEISKVNLLLDYHRLNGGLSRYVKIRYFYETILKESITDEKVLEYASKFTEVMKKELLNPNKLIQDTVDFIKKNHTNFDFHIVSGSDEKELRFLCTELNLSDYFISINGSPTTKNQLVKDLLEKYCYLAEQTILIGDSINDYEAAKKNNIRFYGYNNLDLKGLKQTSYITNFQDFKLNK